MFLLEVPLWLGPISQRPVTPDVVVVTNQAVVFKNEYSSKTIEEVNTGDILILACLPAVVDGFTMWPLLGGGAIEVNFVRFASDSDKPKINVIEIGYKGERKAPEIQYVDADLINNQKSETSCAARQVNKKQQKRYARGVRPKMQYLKTVSKLLQYERVVVRLVLRMYRGRTHTTSRQNEIDVKTGNESSRK